MDRLKNSDQFSAIWGEDEDSLRNRLVPLFVSLGTNIQLKNLNNLYRCKTQHIAHVVAIAILLCQHRLSLDSVLISSKDRSLLRDIEDGETYDVVKFFRKRSSCQCLDRLYYRMRAYPRMAKCVHCDDIDNRNHMYLCGRCKYVTYCCGECQAAEWPDHKEWCRQQT